jgi:hypothetical protein
VRIPPDGRSSQDDRRRRCPRGTQAGWWSRTADGRRLRSVGRRTGRPSHSGTIQWAPPIVGSTMSLLDLDPVGVLVAIAAVLAYRRVVRR